jgi:hypothetical protein
MPFDEEGKHSLADIVMQVWLFDSKMVEAQHAWHTWKTPRRMECFQPANLTGKAPITITEDRLAQAIKDAGDWFAKHNRGRKLFMTPRFVDNEIQISIRRGDCQVALLGRRSRSLRTTTASWRSVKVPVNRKRFAVPM